MAFLGAIVLIATGAATPPPELEAFLSYPFVSDIAGNQRNETFAWLEMRNGVRAVWIAEGPSAKPRLLYSSGSDDGMELAGLSRSGDGKVLAWSRGGGEHNPWANGLAPPNPASAVDQPKLEIWASVSGGTPQLLGEGEEPAVSATGRIAYLKDDAVWIVDPRGDAKPAKLFYDRGKDGSLAWSPDGRKLAFVSRRGDHSFVGVYADRDTPIMWLSPATAIDGNPAWSPDGSQIAFSRQAGDADLLALPLIEKPSPFSIWVASATDGHARRVWQSLSTLNGSYPGLPDGLFLMWGANSRLTFRAELDGWPHLYSLAVPGGEPVLLTPGQFMVEHVLMSPDRMTLFFDGNMGTAPGDIDRRHLFRVSVERPGAVALTPGTGLEWTPVPVGAKSLAYVGSTATTPMRAMLADLDGGHSRAVRADTLDIVPPLVSPRPVTFIAADGTLVHGQLFDAGGAKVKPGLIFVHGGPPRQMLLGWSYMDYYSHAYAMNQYYASRGYVVLSVNYRLGIGYGRAFQHAAKAGPAGNSEYQDVVAGARFLQRVPGVDPARMGIWGGSYGGLLTAHALARDSAIFKAGVDFHGVHDWSLYPGRISKPQRYEQGDYELAMKSAFESSPEASLSGWKSPVLLIHGDDDRNVRFDQTVDLARRLGARGVRYEELILPNEIHGFLRYDSWLRADTAAVYFLDRELKN